MVGTIVLTSIWRSNHPGSFASATLSRPSTICQSPAPLSVGVVGRSTFAGAGRSAGTPGHPDLPGASGSMAGFSATGGRLGSPLFDVTKYGQTFPDAGRVMMIDNPLPHAGDQFGYASTSNGASTY